MKALSLTQPWASLVAVGAKRIETRSWASSYRGGIAIHASKGFPTWAREACDEEPFYHDLITHGLLWPMGDETLTHGASERFAALPLGAIVAVACLVEIVHTGDMQNHIGRGGQIYLGSKGTWQLTEREGAFGDYSPGRFAWCLSDVHPLVDPIACKGALGLWDVPEDVARQVEASCR